MMTYIFGHELDIVLIVKFNQSPNERNLSQKIFKQYLIRLCSIKIDIFFILKN